MTTTPTNFTDLIEADLSQLMLKPGKVVNAVVIAISDDYVTVDAGLKSESDIPVNEFMQSGEITVNEGDSVEVLIEQIELGDGTTHFHVKKRIKQVFGHA